MGRWTGELHEMGKMIIPLPTVISAADNNNVLQEHSVTISQSILCKSLQNQCYGEKCAKKKKTRYSLKIYPISKTFPCSCFDRKWFPHIDLNRHQRNTFILDIEWKTKIARIPTSCLTQE